MHAISLKFSATSDVEQRPAASVFLALSSMYGLTYTCTGKVSLLLSAVERSVVVSDSSRSLSAARFNRRGFVCSLLLHAALLALLIWLMPERAGSGGRDDIRPGTIVLAIVDDVEQITTYQEEVFAEVDANYPAMSSATDESEPPGQSQVNRSVSDTELIPPNDFGWLPPDASALRTTGDLRPRATVAELTAADLEAIRADQKRLAAAGPSGPPATVSLFGSQPITGQRFVFVIDRSKSMGAQGLGVLGKARNQLGDALRSLADHHLFQIVAFHHSTVMMNRREMLPASESNIEHVADFLDQLAPYGGTNYEGAIYTALALQPDILVLLTDGDEPGLNAGQMAAIQRACGGKTQIHCLQFGWESMAPNRGFLRELAEKTGGSYRYVCVPEWEKTSRPSN